MNSQHDSGRPRTLSESLRRTAAQHPDSEFVFPSGRMSYAHMNTRVDQFARMFTEAGIQSGQHIGIWMPASLDTIAAILGCSRIGSVAVPINDRFRAGEFRYIVEHADLSVVLTTGRTDHMDRPREVGAALPGMTTTTDGQLCVPEASELRRVIVLDAHHDDTVGGTLTDAADLGLSPAHAGAESLAPATVTVPDVEHRDSIAYLMYTSGTSATPKACIITNGAVVAQGRALSDTRYVLDATSVFWCPLPLFHTAGLATLNACIASGATFVHPGVFDPTQSLRAMAEEGVTHAIPCFETIWMRILDHPEFASTDLSTLRVLMNTGGEDLLRKLQSRVPHAVQLANYGITEGSGHVAMTTIDDDLDTRVTTGGFPLPGMETRIVDLESGAAATAGRQGEILFRGGSRFAGYYKDPEATAAAIDKEGWFHSGDLGIMTAEGRLAYRGRVKDMLKVGGENVAPLEIESYLLRHPAVTVAAVVGVPDDYYGEVPAAYIELTPGYHLGADELIDFCRDSIATYKIPRYVRFVDTWPMSGTKIRKVDLRHRITAELSALGITEAPRIRSSRARAASTLSHD